MRRIETSEVERRGSKDDAALVFVLAQEHAGDRDEIGEVPSEFEALQSGPVDCDVEILVTNEPLVFPPEPERVIYRRRER